ncbi:NAD(P)-dependent oxidoreductase [Steroidobacter sp.]|uniref:NAD(P)-dependent oxidoreductase n=1 Tax=Steroidobacter sp. TaxID=1978227 RepID=UPI0039F5971E
MHLLVYGGTGNIGQRIVREALDRGHEVTLVTRDPARVKEKHDRLKVVTGDVLDSASVAKLAPGHDVVISAVGANRANNPDYAIYRKAAESLVTALRSLGPNAPRLIAVGGAGSLEIAPGVLLVTKVPERYRAEVLGQKDALDYYRSVSDVRWTYFSPAGSIAAGQRTGKFRLGGDQLVTDAKGDSKISIEDYAVALIDEAEQAKHLRQRFTIGY